MSPSMLGMSANKHHKTIGYANISHITIWVKLCLLVYLSGKVAAMDEASSNLVGAADAAGNEHGGSSMILVKHSCCFET